MEAFDTNVLVRLLVRDDEDQGRRAELAWRHAIAADGAWIATVVLVEVAWVLRVAYKFDRSTTASALRRLLDSDGVVVEGEAATRRALASFETGPADFSDYVILEAARNAGALPLRTFDERLARAHDAEQVP
ncbi:MAG TPA: type II toxin-antitoxin system VapC family toxin [Polyangiales bacterium]